MRVFLSHATDEDGPIASFLKAILLRVGVDVLVLPGPGGTPPGRDWVGSIREGLLASDELFSLLTPSSKERPWIAAEWACFWIQDKPTTPLLVGTSRADLWEPIGSKQPVDLLNHEQVLALLERLADATGEQPAHGVDDLSNRVVKEIPTIRQRSRRLNLEVAFSRISRNMVNGTDNIDKDDVYSLIEGGRVEDLVALADRPDAGQVKLRHLPWAWSMLDRSLKPGRSRQTFRINTRQRMSSWPCWGHGAYFGWRVSGMAIS